MRLRAFLNAVVDGFTRLPLPARVVAGSLLFLLTMLMGLVVVRVVLWWVVASQQSSVLEPKISAKLGFMESSEQLNAALRGRNELLNQLAFADSGDSGRGAAILQQEIRRLASTSGMALVGSEVLEPEKLEHLVKLAVNFKVAGSARNVADFISSVEAFRPFIFISSLSLSGQRRLNGRRVEGVQQTESILTLELELRAYQLTEST